MAGVTEDFLLDNMASQAMFADGSHNIPLAALRITCGARATDFVLDRIVIDPAVTPKLKAILTADNQVLLDYSNFAAAVEVQVGSFIHGLVVSEEKNVFLTYIVPEDFVGKTIEVPLAVTPYCVELSGSEVELSTVSAVIPSTHAKEVIFAAGYNTELVEDKGIKFSAAAGAGAGFEPVDCTGTSAAYISNISGVAPDTRGNIQLQGDACITAVPTADSTIGLDAHCPPCCRCKDFHATAKFVRYVATEYSKLAHSVCSAADMYVSTVERFANEGCSCCSAFGSLTSRFRVWPHQNFKLLAQALIQNNTKYDIALSQVDFGVTVTAKASVTATDENGTVYQIAAGQPLQVDTLPYSSYSYFKAKNPSPITSQLVGVNSVQTSVVVEGGATCSTGSNHNNSMSSCSGYMMVNTGFVITDPVFRKIVSLSTTTPEVHVDMAVSGPGTSSCPDSPNIDIAGSARHCVGIRANKTLADQCAPATATRMFVSGDDLVMLFDKHVNVQSAIVTVQVLGYSSDGQSGAYTELTSQQITLTDTVDPGLEIRMPKPAYSPGASSIIVYKASFAATGIHTKCGTNNVPVNAAPFELATAVSL